MFHPEQINWLAVLAATVAHQVIGFLWYGPIFGKMWMRAVGLTEEQVGSGASSIAIASLAALVMSAAFALLLTIGTGVTLVTGVIWGLVLAIGFVVTTTVINGVFERRNWTVIGLFAAYETVTLAVMGAILGAWR